MGTTPGVGESKCVVGQGSSNTPPPSGKWAGMGDKAITQCLSMALYGTRLAGTTQVALAHTTSQAYRTQNSPIKKVPEGNKEGKARKELREEGIKVEGW